MKNICDKIRDLNCHILECFKDQFGFKVYGFSVEAKLSKEDMQGQHVTVEFDTREFVDFDSTTKLTMYHKFISGGFKDGQSRGRDQNVKTQVFKMACVVYTDDIDAYGKVANRINSHQSAQLLNMDFSPETIKRTHAKGETLFLDKFLYSFIYTISCDMDDCLC